MLFNFNCAFTAWRCAGFSFHHSHSQSHSSTGSLMLISSCLAAKFRASLQGWRETCRMACSAVFVRSSAVLVRSWLSCLLRHWSCNTHRSASHSACWLIGCWQGSCGGWCSSTSAGMLQETTSKAAWKLRPYPSIQLSRMRWTSCGQDTFGHVIEALSFCLIVHFKIVQFFHCPVAEINVLAIQLTVYAGTLFGPKTRWTMSHQCRKLKLSFVPSPESVAQRKLHALHLTCF